MPLLVTERRRNNYGIQQLIQPCEILYKNVHYKMWDSFIVDIIGALFLKAQFVAGAKEVYIVDST